MAQAGDIARLDAAIADLVERTAAWRERARLLAWVPDVGVVTAASLVALLPELGRLDAKAIASLAGVAPFARTRSTTLKNRARERRHGRRWR